jgi:NADH-quinone oxidoreductase subunit H
MEELVTILIEKFPLLQSVPVVVIHLALQVLAAVLMLMVFVAPFAGVTSFVERRIAARMMSRVGPNRVGPQGILQFLADGVKSLFKEDIIPSAADQPLFRFAPYLVFSGMFAAFVTIPFTSKVIVADLNVGIFYVIAVTSIVAVGVIMSGWASNNKWSLLGGMRAAAQIVSYEIPTALSILLIAMLAGSLSFQEMIAAQGPHPWQWFLFHNPFTLATFFIFFISALAEGNRTPFDLPEAESELVSGYNTEYSGMRFVFFFFEEWANLYLIAAISTALFLGGWQLPETIGQWAAVKSSVLLHLLQFATFFLKSLTLVFIIIWIRWTLPRVRVDQLMSMCWKYFVPFGFINILGNAVWMILLPEGSLFMNYALFIAAVALVLYFCYRVFYQLSFTQSKVHLNPFI